MINGHTSGRIPLWIIGTVTGMWSYGINNKIILYKLFHKVFEVIDTCFILINAILSYYLHQKKLWNSACGNTTQDKDNSITSTLTFPFKYI